MTHHHRLGFAAAAAMALAGAAAPVSAREALGMFERWAAFADPSPRRCYAIARPINRPRDGQSPAFASIGSWPGQGIRNQLHVRLSRKRADSAQVTLSVGERRFALVAGEADAWAADRRADAAIVAAIRAGRSMSVESVATSGQPFVDAYALRGAATAIDAAALDCARRK